MLKVWGRVNSLNVQKVLWALAELKVSYERTDAGMQFGVVNEPFYKKMNPNSRVPTDLRQRADADRWMDWASTTLQPVMHPVFWGLVRTPPEKRDMAAIEEANKALGGTFRALGEGLGGRKDGAG